MMKPDSSSIPRVEFPCQGHYCHFDTFQAVDLLWSKDRREWRCRECMKRDGDRSGHTMLDLILEMSCEGNLIDLFVFESSSLRLKEK